MLLPYQDEDDNEGRGFNSRRVLQSGIFSAPAACFAFKDDPETEGEIKDLEGKIENTFEEFKGLIDQQEKEIDKYGETTQETANKLEKAESDLQEMGEELKELQSRLGEMEKKAGRPGAFGGEGGDDKTPGEKFVESDAYEEFKSGRDETKAVEFGSSHEQKDLTGDASSAGDVVRPMRRDQIVAPPMRDTRIRDLLNVVPTSSDTVEYIEETQFYNLETALTADAASADTNIEVENPNGLYPNLEIEVGGETHTIASISGSTVTLNSGLSSAKSAGDLVTAETFEATPETEPMPHMGMEFDLKSTNVKDLGHGIPMTRNILEDAPRLRNHVNTRGMEGLKIAEEDQILYGDGTSQQLQGLMTHPNVPSYNWSSGQTGDTKYDAIRRAMTIARLAEYPVTGAVLHPDDVEDLETIKGSDGQYVYLMLDGGGQQRVVWRVPYVETTAIKSGEFLVGAFGMGAEIFDRRSATVRISESHKDFFTRRMLQVLIEERIAMAIYRPQSFVKGVFDSAP